MTTPNQNPAPDSDNASRRSWPEEVGGAFGDLGTFIPHTLGAISIAGLSPVGVLAGFGLFYIASGWFYRLPIPVQPMKAVSAVLLTSGLSASEIAATGVLIGLALIGLGVTGITARLAYAVPQTVTTGLQLGLGIGLGWLSLGLLSENWWLGAMVIALLIGLLRIPGLPATLIVLALAIVIGELTRPGQPGLFFKPVLASPELVLPGLADLEHALGATVLPQLALTITNAIIITAAMSRDFFGRRACRATPANLALSSGIANLILAPFGALPMCHGAGGLAAHYRFGARTGAAPLILGITLLMLGLMFADAAVSLLSMIPTAAVGALLLFSSAELAWSKRLVDARPLCLPVIGITAAVTVLADPLWGLLCGWSIELLAGRVGSPRRNRSADR